MHYKLIILSKYNFIIHYYIVAWYVEKELQCIVLGGPEQRTQFLHIEVILHEVSSNPSCSHAQGPEEVAESPDSPDLLL